MTRVSERVNRQTEEDGKAGVEIDYAGVPPCVQDTKARPKGRKQPMQLQDNSVGTLTHSGQMLARCG